MTTVVHAEKNDFSQINHLLNSANLPLVDTNENTEYFFKALDNGNNIIGAIGLEVYGRYGLLRSLVVNPDFRNKGIAEILVKKVMELSSKLGLKATYLLTTTADKYFDKKGFLRITREDADQEIKQSKEFNSICPVSAVVMRKVL